MLMHGRLKAHLVWHCIRYYYYGFKFFSGLILNNLNSSSFVIINDIYVEMIDEDREQQHST